MNKLFDPRITFGSVITLATLFFAGAMWVSRIDAEMATQREALLAVQKADKEMSVRVDAVRDIAATRQEVLLTRLARIEAILERLEKRQ